MICPKCQDLMRTVDRDGIHIEQCGRCRGIFLDHGELEAIASAEQRYYAAPMAGGRRGDSPPPYRGGASHGYPSSPPHRVFHDSPRPYGGHGGYGSHGGYGGRYKDSPPHYGHGGHGGHYGHRRNKSFLERLFD